MGWGTGQLGLTLGPVLVLAPLSCVTEAGHRPRGVLLACGPQFCLQSRRHGLSVHQLPASALGSVTETRKATSWASRSLEKMVSEAFLALKAAKTGSEKTPKLVRRGRTGTQVSGIKDFCGLFSDFFFFSGTNGVLEAKGLWVFGCPNPSPVKEVPQKTSRPNALPPGGSTGHALLPPQGLRENAILPPGRYGEMVTICNSFLQSELSVAPRVLTPALRALKRAKNDRLRKMMGRAG